MQKAISKPESTTDYILSTSRDYSIYTCTSRGIPHCGDGLKDSQRKALYLIKGLNDKIKTVSLSGLLISSNLFLHGDASASETLSLMAAPYCNNVPFLQGIGAFGTKVGPTDWGAPRYTYLKTSMFTKELIYPDFDIVPMKENYDGSVMEPKHFLPLVPLALLNGISGIAVGWSTDILPHNLNDIIDATLSAIDGRTVKQLAPKYDFLNCQIDRIEGNSWSFKGKLKIIGSTTIVVEELPPDLSLEKFKVRLNKLEEDDLIQTYYDRSSKFIEVEIKFKRGSLEGWTEDHAIDFLKLRSKQSERIVVLDWTGNAIKQFPNAEELVKDFVEWRLKWYDTRYKKLKADAETQLNWQRAIKLCIDKKLPQFLPLAANKAEIVDKITTICKSLILDDDQINRLSALPSYRWAKDALAEVEEKINNLVTTIAEYDVILASPDEQRKIYRKEVSALKKLPEVVRSGVVAKLPKHTK
jgi:DNA gyrase/topoisomerase IV subunit A